MTSLNINELVKILVENGNYLKLSMKNLQYSPFFQYNCITNPLLGNNINYINYFITLFKNDNIKYNVKVYVTENVEYFDHLLGSVLSHPNILFTSNFFKDVGIKLGISGFDISQNYYISRSFSTKEYLKLTSTNKENFKYLKNIFVSEQNIIGEFKNQYMTPIKHIIDPRIVDLYFSELLNSTKNKKIVVPKTSIYFDQLNRASEEVKNIISILKNSNSINPIEDVEKKYGNFIAQLVKDYYCSLNIKNSNFKNNGLNHLWVLNENNLDFKKSSIAKFLKIDVNLYCFTDNDSKNEYIKFIEHCYKK